MFRQDYYIHTYEVDAFKRLQVPVIMKYFQDVMVHNVDSLGVSADFHKNQNLYWVLIDYEIDIHHLPYGKQYVSCGTLPYSFKRVYGYRIWEMKDKQDNLLATGKGKFVLINIDTKEIVTLAPDMTKLYKGSKQQPEAIPFSKNKPLAADVTIHGEETVKASHIDINNHMNNVEYVIMAYNYLPSDITQTHYISNIRVTFKKECYQDDSITIKGMNKDNQYYFEFYKEDTLLTQIRFELTKKGDKK